MIIKPSNSLLVPGQESLVDSNRRRFMRTTALGAACMASAPLLATTGLADMHGRPLTVANQLRRSADEWGNLLRDSVLSSLNLVPVVGGFLSYIGALFIPNPGKSPEQLWREILDTRISEALLSLVQRDLVGLSHNTTLYRNAIAAEDKDEIRITSIAVNTVFTQTVPGFQIPREEVAMLPLFAIAATMHLCLLRDIAVKGKELGFNDAALENYRQELRTRIEQYTQYVDAQVEAAVEKAKRDNPNTGVPSTRNQPLSAMLEVKAQLKVSVLDLRDTWYAFDAIRYPGAWQVFINREVLSPICGWWDLESTAPSTIPDWAWTGSDLRRIDMWNNSQWRTSWLMGFRVHNGPRGQVETGKRIGQELTMELQSGEYIHGVEGNYSTGVANMTFLVGPNGTRRKFGRDPEELESVYRNSYPGHILSSLRSVGKGRNNGAAVDAVSGCIFGWRLLNRSAMPISTAAFEQIEPTIAPQLLDWIVR